MKKRILISNDDGIYAPGIQAMYEAVKDLGEVTVVAPAGEQSAVGHAITLSDPIKAKPISRPDGFRGYAVGGTPADCVKLAVCALLPKPPDLVLSGINLGPNTGISVIYSGTVSAATEGVILGIPSVAISLGSYQKPRWDVAARVARQIAQHVLRVGLPPDTLLNVNVPNLPAKQIRGYRTTLMGRSRFVEKFDRRTDPQGNVYYWMDGELELLGDEGETDIIAVREGFVSLTPIWFDLTHRAALPAVQAWKLKWRGR